MFTGLKNKVLPIYEECKNICRRLRSIDMHFKAERLVKDDIFTFSYKGKDVKFYLPFVLFDQVQMAILDNHAFHEYTLLERMRKTIKPGSVILDCGANIGNHTLYFAMFCKAKHVYSFEPQSVCASIFRKNMNINNLGDDLVTLYPQALGNQPGTVNIEFYDPKNMGATTFAYDANGETPVTTIDECNFSHVDFMKIDVEGFQLELLQGATKLLREQHPTIWIEMNDGKLGVPGYNYEHEVTKPQKLLADFGYELVDKLSNCDYVYSMRQR